MELTLICYSACIADEPILFGFETYPVSSGVCVSAFHSGAIGEKGGQFTINIKQGLPSYSGKKQMGLESQPHGTTNLSFQFTQDPNKAFEPFVGMEVDLKSLDG